MHVMRQTAPDKDRVVAGRTYAGLVPLNAPPAPALSRRPDPRGKMSLLIRRRQPAPLTTTEPAAGARRRERTPCGRCRSKRRHRADACARAPRRRSAERPEARLQPPRCGCAPPTGPAPRPCSGWCTSPSIRAAAGTRSRRWLPRRRASSRCRRRRERGRARDEMRTKSSQRKLSWRISRACLSGLHSSASVQARPATRRSCRNARSAASCVSRGSNAANSSKRSGRKRSRSENCHRIGPSFGPSRNSPCARKFASGASMSRSFLLWVMKRLPFTAKTKSSGVASRQRPQLSGRCSR